MNVRAHVTSGLERLIARSFPLIARRSLRRGLHQIWARGDFGMLPRGPFILAANHHSWWDLYLIWEVRRRLARPLAALMHEETLRRFPFFRRLDVLSRLEVREALRRLQAGWVLQIFPEGEMRPSGSVERLEGGLEFFARRAQAPIVPLALRVAMRGAERPEAFLVLGPLIPVQEASAETFLAAINDLLAELDAEISAQPPEASPPGFAPWLPKTRRFDERLARLGGLWRR